MSLRNLNTAAADDEGPFGEHLRAKLAQLGRRPDLAGAVARLVHHGVPPDEGSYSACMPLAWCSGTAAGSCPPTCSTTATSAAC